jgi:hypothetical protein
MHADWGLDTHGLGIQLEFSNRPNQEGALDHSLNNWTYSTILQFIFSSVLQHFLTHSAPSSLQSHTKF